MGSFKKIIPEFWHHTERVAGEKGQQYIFRSKWLLLIQATCVLTLVPLIVSTFFFYKNNKTETITDLLLETEVLSKGAAIDIEIFLNQYLLALKLISTQNKPVDLMKKDLFESVFNDLARTNVKFASLYLFDKRGHCVVSTQEDRCPWEVQQPGLISLQEEHGYTINRIITQKGEIKLLVSLKLVCQTGDSFFLAGIINDKSVDVFLKKLKVRDVIDIFLMDKDGILVTASRYFGRPGFTPEPLKSKDLPLSRTLTNPRGDKKGGQFLFSGVSKIGHTDMRVGILMANKSFEAFMARIKSHIFIMFSFSVLFVLIAVLVLVTYVVQLLYKADKVRQLYLNKAARSSRMASIGKLAAGVAHEINNPLAIINEKAGLLQDLFTFRNEYKKDERILGIIDSIIESVDRAGTITHRLLGFARKTDSSIEKIDMEETIEKVTDLIKKEAEYKSINVEIDIPEDLPDIKTDQGKLLQILINLVNNAIAALSENGTLSIKVRNNIENDSIDIFVQDNGCGIAEENKKKIFEPFFTTKSKIGGTGLGLALTYGLIRDLHGTLELDSEPSKGTTFIITLPYEIKKGDHLL